MISSMTAYARCENIKENVKVFIEVRTYNSRYLDIALKMPSDFAEFEELVKKKISSALFRGRVEIRIQIEDSGKNETEYYVDHDKAKAYFDLYSELKDNLGLKDEVRFEQLLKSEGVLKKNDRSDNTKYVPFLEEALENVLNDIIKMRNLEGESLYTDLSERLRLISSFVDDVESESKNLVLEYQSKLKQKILDLTAGEIEIDSTRLAQETAFIADKSDISEEIVRIKSHLKQFNDYMDQPEPCGRKLNFLLQELHREVNTAGVKSGSFTISKDCVEIKSELEKLREQVQNVE